MDDLYRENILDHYKHPHNWSPPEPELAEGALQFHDLNPLCGDELHQLLVAKRTQGARVRSDRDLSTALDHRA